MVEKQKADSGCSHGTEMACRALPLINRASPYLGVPAEPNLLLGKKPYVYPPVRARFKGAPLLGDESFLEVAADDKGDASDLGAGQGIGVEKAYE